MKKITILLMLVISFTTFSQTINIKKLVKETYFEVNEAITDLDTVVYYYFSFQNKKYTHVADVGSILIREKSQIETLNKKLKEFSEVKDKQNIDYICPRYTLSIYDFSDDIYLSDKEGKFTRFSKEEALKISNDLLKHMHYLKM
jgi:hypothetical protein